MSKKKSDMYNCRGKSIETGEWVYGKVFFIGSKAFILSVPKNQRAASVLDQLGKYTKEVDVKSLGRYIGEDDTDGRSIYEGDIILEEIGYGMKLETGDAAECYYLIKWISKYNSFIPIPFESGKLYKDIHLHLETMKAIRCVPHYVVGNVYDNSLDEFESKYVE